MPASLARPDYAPRRQPRRRRRHGLPHRHAGAGPPAADAARSATRRRGLDTRGLHQRLPRLAARHGRPAGVEGGQAARRSRRRASCPRSTRSSRATAVLGTQRVESDPERTVEGVFAMWYGKGPGVDRAGDALKHGNAYGSSPHGGVLVVAGDDHGCVSSSMPHQSDQAFQAWHMPVVRAGQRRRVPRVRPVRLGAVALLGQLGRLHGAVGSGRERRRRSTSTRSTRASPPGRTPTRSRAATGYRAPADGLHYRWPDLPSLKIEAAPARQARRGARVRARQQHRPRHRRERRTRRVGIVTCGKAHFDLHGGAAAASTSRSTRSPPPACASTRSASPYPARADAPATRSREGLDEILVDRGEGPASSRRSCATCSTTRADAAGASSASATRRRGRWSRRSASCGRRA